MANTISGFTTFVTKTIIDSAPMNTNLSNLKDYAPIWHKYTKTFSDFSADTSTNQVVLVTATSSENVLGVMLKTSASFTATSNSVTAVTVSLGTSATSDLFLDASDVFQAVTTTASFAAPAMEPFFANTAIIAEMISTGNTLSSLSIGSFDCWILKNTRP